MTPFCNKMRFIYKWQGQLARLRIQALQLASHLCAAQLFKEPCGIQQLEVWQFDYASSDTETLVAGAAEARTG